MKFLRAPRFSHNCTVQTFPDGFKKIITGVWHTVATSRVAVWQINKNVILAPGFETGKRFENMGD
jgi:hypothetical protein